MRLVMSGDWQADVGNLDRLAVHVDQLVGALGESAESRNTFFVHLGDFKERMNPVDVRVENFLIRSFGRIKQACRGYYVVRGNHDSITTQDGSPSCMPLAEVSGALGVADQKWERHAFRLAAWRKSAPHYLLLYLVPYFRDRALQAEQFRQAAEDARRPEYRDATCGAVGRDNVKVLAFHSTVAGCSRGAHRSGAPAEGLTAAEMGADAYDVCVGGHEHRPQEMPPNIVYCGSPFPMDWGECNVRHRFLELDVKEHSTGRVRG